MADEGVKFDEGKAPWNLFPWEAAEEVAKVLQYGATKYAPRNWEKGMQGSRLWSAALRHMIAYHSGQDRDPESGLLHLAQAACNLLFLLTYHLRGMDRFDDRPRYAVRYDGEGILCYVDPDDRPVTGETATGKKVNDV
jgi:hypothetical protein